MVQKLKRIPQKTKPKKGEGKCLQGIESADGSSIAGVAKNWDISKDVFVYTFHLRKYSKHSNGKPLTVEGYVFSLRCILENTLAEKYENLL